ncbi:M20 metallopeptidase family protein [Microbacterium sp. No. 7]|uniref:M20 metallopeptidase family protein n=1 Tax=Microbacterium sp. No. 7 TaxID=1714373 RepID=UPI0006D02622|nr:M20 family metallopeptidase [Microbacterium sp. No. 7]ALJ19308.1 amidohydrolase [Microbacterium sp. No. 7]
MTILDEAKALGDDLTGIRARLHATPEVGLVLPETQRIVLEELEGLGLEITTGTDTTSVVGVLRGGRRREGDPRSILLRGDMDALPVVEETGLPYASTNGAMHACGHDFHTTALIGAARLLAAHRDEIAGDVVFMFQPGEEGFDGAGVMIREGVLDVLGRRPDAAYALHVISGIVPHGVFEGRAGTMMSASHRLVVEVTGKAGHGSLPYLAKDPILAAVQMINALQSMLTRSFETFDPAVLTVGLFHAGSKANVIPDDARFEATVRRFSEGTRETLEKRIGDVLEGVARAMDVEVDYEFITEYPTTVNDPAEIAFAEETLAEMFGEGSFRHRPHPIAGSEDFSRVLAEVPGVFMNLGAHLPEHTLETAPFNHSPRADFDPAVLPVMSATYAQFALKRLDLLAGSPA